MNTKEDYDRRMAEREQLAEATFKLVMETVQAVLEGRGMVSIETGQDARGNRHTEIRLKRDS